MRIIGLQNTLLSIFLLVGSFSQAQDAKEIIRKSDEKWRGTISARSEMTIEIIRPKWTRSMSMKSWAKGEDYSMIVITAPAKEKGIVFLKREKEVWNWVPSIERTIKLPPSMMSQSWMGTDFTNDDLVKESSAVSDYSHALSGDSLIEGRDCYKIILTPLPDAAVVWGEIIVFVDKRDYIQLRAEMYDEDGYLVNIMNSSDIQKMGGRMIATRTELIPVDKKGQKTVMKMDAIEFDIPIEDSFFSTQNMKRVK